MMKGYVGLKKAEKIEFTKIASKIFKRFASLEAEFGGDRVRFAMRRYLVQFSEQNRRRLEIAKLERELVQLKRKELR